jgi:hypothetical protein
MANGVTTRAVWTIGADCPNRAVCTNCAIGTTCAACKLNRPFAMQRLTRLTSIVAAILAAIPAYAQVFKWVDERGVTNYSNEAPAAGLRRVKPVSVADRISVYAPAPALQRAVSLISANEDRILANRIDSLERQLSAERESAQSAADAESRAAQSAYAQCLADRRVDCDYDTGYYPYGPGAVLTVFRHPPPHRIPHMTRSRVGAETIARLRSERRIHRAGDLRP